MRSDRESPTLSIIDYSTVALSHNLVGKLIVVISFLPIHLKLLITTSYRSQKYLNCVLADNNVRSRVSDVHSRISC
jgi:hypothetical protein